jgi:hypothetical protein
MFQTDNAQTLLFASSEGFEACPYLQGRPQGVIGALRPGRRDPESRDVTGSRKLSRGPGVGRREDAKGADMRLARRAEPSAHRRCVLVASRFRIPSRPELRKRVACSPARRTLRLETRP